MSGKNNVNPGQYKVAGRERQGDDVVHEVHRQQLGEAEARNRRASREPPAPVRRPAKRAADDSKGAHETGEEQ